MKKKKIIIGIGIVIVGICAVLGYMFFQDMRQEESLKRELKKLVNMNLKTGKVDMTIKTKGDYAIVEKTAKEVLSEYLTLYQETIKLIESKQIANILTIENYEKERPEFTESKKIIASTREKIQTNLTKLATYTDVGMISNRIEEKKLDTYYVNFYNTVMINDLSQQDFKKAQEEIVKTQEIMNQLFDVEIKILEFLGTYNAEWRIENDSLVFERDELLQQYLALVQEIPKGE